MPLQSPILSCRHCGHDHQSVPLAPGERAHCARCDAVLAMRPAAGPDGTLAFTLTGLILALPAALLPFVSTGKLGLEHTGHLLTSVEGLWDHGMRFTAVWVCLCGGAVPLALLLVLAGLLLPVRLGWPPFRPRILSRIARSLGYWAIPEVQVLAVLVALIKLGRLVNVSVGPGFWCYAGFSFALLLAWRNFELESRAHRSEPGMTSPSS